MMLILFRSKLTDAAGDDYTRMNEGLRQHAEGFPGFVDAKSFLADDGERLAVVRWRDAATLQAWAEDVRHTAAKKLGRSKWYEYYEVEVAEVVRTSSFSRSGERVEAPATRVS